MLLSLLYFSLNLHWILIESSALYFYDGNPYRTSVTLFDHTPLKSLY